MFRNAFVVSVKQLPVCSTFCILSRDVESNKLHHQQTITEISLRCKPRSNDTQTRFRAWRRAPGCRMPSDCDDVCKSANMAITVATLRVSRCRGWPLNWIFTLALYLSHRLRHLSFAHEVLMSCALPATSRPGQRVYLNRPQEVTVSIFQL